LRRSATRRSGHELIHPHQEAEAADDHRRQQRRKYDGEEEECTELVPLLQLVVI